MADPEFSFTPNANPVVELGLGDTRVPSGTGVWDSALWDDPGALWQGTEPSWWDVSCFAIEAEIARGRERATDRFVPGTAGLVLNNADGWADMAGSPGEIAAVSLRPGRAIRIGVDVHSIGVVWLFRGIIDRVTPTYDPVHLDYVKLDCIDLLGEVGHVKLTDSAPVGADDTTVQRLNRILDVCNHPAEKRVLTPDVIYPVKLIQTSYGQQAIDLLGQAADSAGGIVYGDELGNVCYKPLGWQNYQAGSPNGGAIGNINPGIPGIPAITPPPYLTTNGAPVTTPDAGSLTLPGGFTIFATVRTTVGSGGTSFLAGQWATGQLEWKIIRDNVTGVWFFASSGDGTTATTVPFTLTNTPPTGLDEVWAFSVLFDNLAGGSSLRAYRRTGGDELSPRWAAAGPANNVATLPWANRTSPVSIGTATGVSLQTWLGRIYDVELAAASTPTPKGATVWRFDVGDTVAATTGWTDPRGRAWTVGGSAAGHIHPATIPAVPGVQGDICPAGWEVSYDRMDVATKVELNRELPNPVPRLRFNLGTAVGASAGQLNLNNSDQQAATVISVSFTSADGTATAPFVRNLTANAEVRLTDVGDVTNQTRTYRVTGPPVFNTDNYIVPVAWIDGLTAIGGVVDLALTFVPPAPYVVDDPAGQAIYGIETFELTDLASTDDAMFARLATRVLATRGYTAMPRLEAVTLDAKAARGDMATLETMARCLPELPTRYACRLRLDDGRIVFDRNMFAVGTRHAIARDEWTLRIALDDAAWASSPYGKIATTEARDVAAIVGTITAPSAVGIVLTTEATDTIAITGTIVNFRGVIAATEAPDVATITAAFKTGQVFVFEADDVAVITGTVVNFRGVIARTEANDVATIVGTVT